MRRLHLGGRDFAAQREQVARRGVVEGQRAGERADHQQGLVDVEQEPAEVGVDQVEEQVERRGADRRLDRRLGAVARQHHRGDEGVEQAESDHRDQRRPRDDLLRVARLLAVDGGGLEADPGPEREEQADRHRPGRRRGSERARGQALERVVQQHRLVEHEAVGAAALEDHGERQREQDQHLGHQRHPEDRGGQADVEVAQHADDDDRGDGEHQPRDVHPDDGVHRVVGEVGAAADQRSLEHHIGEGRQDSRWPCPRLPETVGDEAVEGTGGGDVPGHRDVSEREQRQRDRGEQEAGGAPSPLPKPTAIGTLPVIAVIGAALATAMKMTATMPMAPFFSPAGRSGLDCCGISGHRGLLRCGIQCIAARHRRSDQKRPLYRPPDNWRNPCLHGFPATSQLCGARSVNAGRRAGEHRRRRGSREGGAQTGEVTAKSIAHSVLEWLRAGYPDGVPGPDRVPLLALLRNTPLSEDELKSIVSEIADEESHAPSDHQIGKDEIERFIEEPRITTRARRTCTGSPRSWPPQGGRSPESDPSSSRSDRVSMTNR